MVHRNPVVALAGHFFQPAFMCKVYRPVAIRDLKLQKIRWLDNYAKQREELQLPTLIHRLCPALRLRSGDGTSLSKGDYHNFRFITIIFYSSAALQMHCNADGQPPPCVPIASSSRRHDRIHTARSCSVVRPSSSQHSLGSSSLATTAIDFAPPPRHFPAWLLLRSRLPSYLPVRLRSAHISAEGAFLILNATREARRNKTKR